MVCITPQSSVGMSGMAPHPESILNLHDVLGCRESSFGHGTLDVLNSTHLLWRWHRNQDALPQVADEHYIVREPDACENQNVVAPPTASVSVATQSLTGG